MSDEYKEEVKYAPDWPPKPKQSVDPSVHATLDSVTNHEPTTVSYTHLTLPTICSV